MSRSQQNAIDIPHRSTPHDLAPNPLPAPASMRGVPIALLLGMIAIFLQGRFLLPPNFTVFGFGLEDLWTTTISPAFAEGLKFTMTQLSMLTLVPSGGWREAWAAWPTGARFELTMLADFGWIASFTFILSRLGAWSMRQIAMARSSVWASCWNWLRWSLPVLVMGDCIENLSTMVALDLQQPMATWRGVVLWIGSVASAIKWTGALGCLVSTLLGVACALIAARRAATAERDTV